MSDPIAPTGPDSVHAAIRRGAAATGVNFSLLDKIQIEVEKDGESVTSALTEFKDYISTETQALSLELKKEVAGAIEVDMDDFMLKVKISVK